MATTSGRSACATHRGAGIGAALLGRTLEQMRQRGSHCAWLLWTEERAGRLYQRFGFQPSLLRAAAKGAAVKHPLLSAPTLAIWRSPRAPSSPATSARGPCHAGPPVLGDGPSPLTPAEYGPQKRTEAERAAAALGAEVCFLDFRDAEIFCSEASILTVADTLRALQADAVITHWRESIHPDHSECHRIVTEATFYASVPHLPRPHPNHPVRALYYAENWEDRFGFDPYLSIDVSEDVATWEQSVTQYALFRGEVVAWPYLDYYRSLLRYARLPLRQAVRPGVRDP